MQYDVHGVRMHGAVVIIVRRALSLVRIWRRLNQGCGVILGSCIALCALAAPQEPNIDRGPAPDTIATAAIAQLRLSDTLADFGERNADPMALIEAAKIRKLLPPPLNAASGETAETRTWQTLLARAAQLAGPNPMVAAFIADVRHLKIRDIPVIPIEIKLLHKQIKHNAADRAEVHFLAGEIAMVYIRPIAAVDLDLFVYDDLNNLICTGGGTGHDSECRWRPRHDGSYLIDVRNNNAAEVEYELAINREIVQR
jgi:hypothetical protein